MIYYIYTDDKEELKKEKHTNTQSLQKGYSQYRIARIGTITAYCLWGD